MYQYPRIASLNNDPEIFHKITSKIFAVEYFLMKLDSLDLYLYWKSAAISFSK